MCKYKVHKLYQRYILKKREDAPQWHIYTIFQAHSLCSAHAWTGAHRHKTEPIFIHAHKQKEEKMNYEVQCVKWNQSRSMGMNYMYIQSLKGSTLSKFSLKTWSQWIGLTDHMILDTWFWILTSHTASILQCQSKGWRLQHFWSMPNVLPVWVCACVGSDEKDVE